MSVDKILTDGIVFKKAKQEAFKGEKKIKFSDFLKGTHGSDSAKKKAEYKYKKALKNQRKKKG
ncbi:hypothetical protein [Parabacteroides bouchesdurhonensis]|uniref:hypothetical protein n=1 Tax=Parabacteroides bouchesdurhonensis TaxID=1936995 RepID=UPI000C841EC6|nr:hypothetical protein [Parabacteroides bouchesdurhonensis]RHJ90136.1 hypothetical protein DW095_13965 [Bacteroides sp. AM07-16]